MMFVDHHQGIHVTRNLRNKRWRYTWQFPSGVVFHSCKSRYSRQQLKDIASGRHELNRQHRESYSVKPEATTAPEVGQ